MGIVQYSTKDAAGAYRDLRLALEKSLARDRGVGRQRIEVQICPVCGADRVGCGWWAKGTPDAMCLRCREEGYFPGERREGR